MIRIKFACLATVCMLLMGCHIKQEEQRTPLRTEGRKARYVPVFDQDSAYYYMERQMAFGYRIPNTAAHDSAAVYLAEELRRHGAEVIVQEAGVRAYDNTLLNAKNIIGSFRSEEQERVLLFAHWDSRPFADHDPDPANHRKPVPGANDGASGVGVLLEIARQIGLSAPRIGVDIIFFDAEDYGIPEFYRGPYMQDSWALGTQYWVRHLHKPGYLAKYGILLDMVGGKDAMFAKEGFSMRYAPRIVEKVWMEARNLGYGQYFDDREGGFITDDHVYVNGIGIPSIDIIEHDPESPTGFNRQWHTIQDTMEFIDRETLKAVGQTVLSVVYKE